MQTEFLKQLILAIEKPDQPDRLLDIDLRKLVTPSLRVYCKALIRWIFVKINNWQSNFSIVRRSNLRHHLENGSIDKCGVTYENLSDDYSKNKFVEAVSFYFAPSFSKKIELEPDHYSAYDSVNKFIVGRRKNSAAFTDKDMKFDTSRYPSLNGIWFNPLGYCLTFLNEQYNYNDIVNAKPGDVVFDLGACYGDTALYFADKVGENGKVYSFEFVESNIKMLHENIERNQNSKSIIELVRNPVWSSSNNLMYFTDQGPGTRVSFCRDEGMDSCVQTVSLDDFVKRNEVKKVNFIKMDIEGAELDALIGATCTLREYKPDLAICVYHKFEHLYEIYNFISDLNLNYVFYFDYYTSNGWEMVLYAKQIERL